MRPGKIALEVDTMKLVEPPKWVTIKSMKVDGSKNEEFNVKKAEFNG
jgi:hypothetical protein